VTKSPIALEFRETGKCASCPVIDCHGHFGPYGGIYFPNVTPEAMIGTMDRAGVQYVISSGHMALVDTDRGNAEMQRITDEYGTRIRGWWAVNPNYPERIERDLHRFSETRGFVGFKFLSDYHRYPITGDVYAPVLQYAR